MSAISKPANSHFEASPTSLSLPTSPTNLSATGSFGVDYGAYQQPTLDDLRQDPVSIDELAACPPVVRTSKPPSGFSPLTATKGPGSLHRENSGGLRSFIRNSTSRPSSKGSSAASKNEDVQSLGNLSIERRGSATTPELTHRRSQDSWSKKTSRGNKGLMYMSSKERLREREAERKRTSGSLPASSSAGFAVEGSVHSGGRNDPFFAETVICEEPSLAHELPIERPMDGPCAIPARDSSLKTSGQSKRSSARRSKREDDAIPEADEHRRSRDTGRRKQGHTVHEQLRSSATSPSFQENIRSYTTSPVYHERLRSSATSPIYGFSDSSPNKNKSVAGRSFLDVSQDDHFLDDDDDDGAPFPAVAQNRRRDQSSDRNGRQRAGQQSPIPPDGLRVKRSSSRLKRLSGTLSPRADERSRESPSPQPVQNPVPAGYERPQSIDSVDDAVESYLCSPRLSQKIKHPQTGRVISFSEVGDSEGSAVFCCVGMGLTRYITAFYDELALTLKLRLITPDRPGVGDSEPYSDGTATPLSWPGKNHIPFSHALLT